MQKWRKIFFVWPWKHWSDKIHWKHLTVYESKKYITNRVFKASSDTLSNVCLYWLMEEERKQCGIVDCGVSSVCFCRCLILSFEFWEVEVECTWAHHGLTYVICDYCCMSLKLCWLPSRSSSSFFFIAMVAKKTTHDGLQIDYNNASCSFTHTSNLLTSDFTSLSVVSSTRAFSYLIIILVKNKKWCS